MGLGSAGAAVIVVAVAVLCGLLWTTTSHSVGSSALAPLWALLPAFANSAPAADSVCQPKQAPLRFQEVRVVDASAFSNQRELVDAVLDSAEPTIIRNLKDVDSWPARQRWTTRNYFQTHVKAFKNVMHSSAHGSTFFYYNKQKPLLAKTSALTWHEPYQTSAEMPSEEFFDRIEKGELIYFSSRVAAVNTTLLADVGEYSAIVRGSRLPVNGPNLWIGSKGVTSRLHWDASDNLYLQLHGEKTFKVFSPKFWRGLYEFSTLHPAARQSQINLDLRDTRIEGDFPLFFSSGAACTGLEAKLMPGDMFVLPAFWFHHVTAVSQMSVSLSVFVQTVHRQVVTNAYMTKVPIQPYWLPRQRQAALRVYLQAVIKGFFDLDKPSHVEQKTREFVSDLLYARYSHFHLDPMLDGDARSQLPAPKPKYEMLYYPKYCGGDERDFGKEDARVLRVSGATIGVTLSQVKSDAKELVLADYLEEAVAAVADTGDEISTILYMCFVFRKPEKL